MRPATWDALWPVRTKPLAMESFVSWLCRLAWSNGLDARTLCNVSETHGNSKHRDLDRYPNPLWIEQLSLATGVDVDDLIPRTLQRWCGTIVENIDESSEIPWLPRAGMRIESGTFGQQVCVSCLREQPTPYLRQEWRLAFLTVCKHHRQLLHDRCADCGAPIQPLRLQSSSLPISICWNCGHDYRNASSVAVELGPFDETLLDAVNSGWGEIPRYRHVHSIAFFRILWKLYRLAAVGRHAKPLQLRFHNGTAMPRIPRTDSLHRLTPAYRRSAIEIAWRLLDDWPHILIEACKDLGIREDDLTDEKCSPPFVLWKAIHEHLPAAPYQASPGEIAAAQRFLEKRGIASSAGAMSILLARQTLPGATRTSNTRRRAPFAHGRSWKLDGISTETRLAALAAARADGMKLGHWVEQALIAALKND